MKSLILIPFYLWKNTFRRWIENFSSPACKICIPFLLSTLSILVLVFYAELENHLQERLKQSAAYHVKVSENVRALDAPLIAELINSEEQLWTQDQSKGSIELFWQLYITAKRKHSSKPISVIVYNRSFGELSKYDTETLSPTIWFLTNNSKQTPSKVEITIGDNSLYARTSDIPSAIKNHLNSDTVIALPYGLGKTLMRNGFLTQISANFRNIEDTSSFVESIEAFHFAERRKITVFSSLGLLQELANIEKIQQHIRIGITVMSGIILSITLGCISWLEFRQESYLLALLRSFGTPRLTLFFHAFLEVSILVGIGIYGAFQSWPFIYHAIRNKLVDFPLSELGTLSINSADTFTIVIAGVIGVILAMVPVAFGLRKPAGLILQ
jgi:hypothetical protein